MIWREIPGYNGMYLVSDMGETLSRKNGREVGLNSSNISACCSGKRKTAGGFRWRWVNE